MGRLEPMEKAQNDVARELSEYVRYGELEELKTFLMAAEAPSIEDVASIRDMSGNSLIHYAAANEHADILDLLLSYASNTANGQELVENWAAARNSEGNNALHWTIVATAHRAQNLASPDLLRIVSALLRLGKTDPLSKNTAGFSSLHYAENTIADGEPSNALVDLLMEFTPTEEDEGMDSDSDQEQEKAIVDSAQAMSDIDLGR